MKNVIAPLICFIITFATLLLPQRISTDDRAQSVYCGAPIPFITLDLSNASGVAYPREVRCAFELIGARDISLDFFAFLVSFTLFYIIALMFLYAKNRYDPHASSYVQSPIKKDLDSATSS